jgi:hypothetical protein
MQYTSIGAGIGTATPGMVGTTAPAAIGTNGTAVSGTSADTSASEESESMSTVFALAVVYGIVDTYSFVTARSREVVVKDP